MSQQSKRNAEEAAIGNVGEARRSKKRRVRGKRTEEPSQNKQAVIEENIKALDQSSNHPQVKSIVSSTKDPQTAPGTPSNPKSSTDTMTPIPIVSSLKNPSQLSASKAAKKSQPHGEQEVNAAEMAVVKSKKSKKKKSKSERHEEQQSTQDLKSWNVSRPSGGVFINHDPVLMPQSDYVVLATKHDVQVYSSATSLLVRSIAPVEPSPIVSYFLSGSNPTQILVGHTRGLLTSYDLETGRRLGQWQSQAGLRRVCFAAQVASEMTVLSVCAQDEKSEALQIHVLQPAGKISTQNLLQKSGLQPTISVSPDHSTIVAFGRDKIYIGSSKGRDQQTTSRSEAIWYEYAVSGRISCCDVRFVESTSTKTNSTPVVNVVVGLQNGAIIVLSDLLAKVIAGVKGSGSVDERGQKLHWHRSAVRAVKWSPDGNYLVSGGDESTLVIWQLETNRKQFLPHLSTSILNISISRSGAQYALRLADNSVMVISTEDLMPSTNITGLSIGINQDSDDLILAHPQHSNQILAAVPTLAITSTFKSATHIQSYDIDTSLQLSKQALTRNLVTTINVGPDGSTLQEPNITHMKISPDAKWLATVDEWAPNPSDLSASYLQEDEGVQQERSREVLLRFWGWNEAECSWEPVTRIDEPHPVSSRSILAMASNPSRSEFVSMGSDGCLKIWTPKARVRDGLAVRGRTGEPLFTWSVARQFQIDKSMTSSTEMASSSGAITYSEDGSILAVSWSNSSTSERVVYFVDPRTGTISLSQPNLLAHGRAKLEFAGRYILALSKTLIVFDTITLQTTYTLTPELKESPAEQMLRTFLAVSTQSNTFVLGVSAPPTTTKASQRISQLSIFDIEKTDQGPIATFPVQDGIRTLLSDSTGHGFIVIDTESRVQRFSPPGASLHDTSSLILSSQSDMAFAPMTKDASGIFGRGNEQLPEQGDVQSRRLLEGADTSEARSRNLDQLLAMSDGGDGGSAALGVNELFERVARAVSGIRVGA